VSTGRFTELWEDHREPLLAYFLRRVSEPADAADLLAETFLVTWRRIATVPEGDDARLWLYGVAGNVLRNHRRGRRRHDLLTGQLRQSLPTTVSAPSADLATIQVALKNLAPDDREVLLLQAWEGLSGPEIAQVLGVSADAVRARLSRARARLRMLLGDYSLSGL
jgi:RNA polymerase sigma-70 factor (ECF subfamily)